MKVKNLKIKREILAKKEVLTICSNSEALSPVLINRNEIKRA